MKSLDQLRDELAEEYNLKRKSGYDEFRAGWNALLTALSERAGEFHWKEASGAGIDHPNNPVVDDFILGAKWQYSKDRARIALAQAQVEGRDHVMDVWRKEKAELEARLAKSEQIKNTEREWRKELEEKLAAAEARIKELEAEIQRELDRKQYL